MKIYRRDQWRAHYAHTERMAKQWPVAVKEVFLHFSDSPGKGIRRFSAQTATMREIQEYHMDSHGWSDIGYHFVVFQRQGVIPIARVFAGRPINFVPAAQDNHNTNTIAICVVMQPGERFKPSTQRRIKSLLRKLKRDIGHGFVVRPHSAVVDTDCPGTEIRTWIRTLPKPF